MLLNLFLILTENISISLPLPTPGPVVNWFDLSNQDMRMTNSIYLATLRNDIISPFTKESDEEGVKAKAEVDVKAKAEAEVKDKKDSKTPAAAPEKTKNTKN